MSPTVALYVLAHFLIFMVIYIIVKIINREPDLESRRNAIFEMNNRPARIEAGEAELAASEREVQKLNRRERQIRESRVDYIPLDDPPATKLGFAILAALLAEGEAGLFYILTAPTMLLGLPPTAWSFFSPFVAVGWILALHVLLGVLVTDKHRPARTIRRAKTGAVLFGIGVIVAVWSVLSGRNLSDPSLIEQLTAAGLITLAALLSVTSAFSSIVASTLHEAQRHEPDLEKLDSRGDVYRRHIELLQRDLDRLKAGSTEGQSITAKSAAPSGVVVAVLLAVLFVGGVSPAKAQAPTRMQDVNAGTLLVSAPVFPSSEACEIVVDISASVDNGSLREILQQTGDHLEAIANTLTCKEIRIVPFAGTPFVSIDEFAVPDQGEIAPCLDVKADSGTAVSAAVGVFYPTVSQARTKAAVSKCEEQRRVHSAEALLARRKALSQIAERLRAIGNLPRKGPCTALFQVVLRSLRRAHKVIVITDGQPTCRPPVLAKSTLVSEVTLVFLLVPPRDHADLDSANVLLDRISELGHVFPESQILLGQEATLSFWKGLQTTLRR